MNPISAINLFMVIFGVCIGSFLNALIHRLPIDKDISRSRSECPKCGKLIYWFENIPVISYIFLKGRCSGCKKSISLRYPLVEILMGVFAWFLLPEEVNLMAYAKFFLKLSVFACFVVHFFIDLKHKLLPNSVNIYLALTLLCLAALEYNWKHIVIGGSLGFFFPLTITWLFYVLRGQVGLGGGDIKLFGALGLYLGPAGIIFNLFVSTFVGAIVSIVLILAKKMDKSNPIPFGPFIILAAITQIYFPKEFNSIMNLIFVVP